MSDDELREKVASIIDVIDDEMGWSNIFPEERDQIMLALLPLIREAQATAWDEGWDARQRAVKAYMAGKSYDEPNPYRTGETT